MKRFLILLFFLSANASATPSYHIQYEYYDVYAWDVEHIEDDILAQSTVVDDGEKFMGRTDWRVKWRYSMVMVNDLCRIYDIRIDFSVVLTMPKLVLGNNTPSHIIDTFDRHYMELYKHEEQHMQHGFEAAKEVEKALWSIDGMDDCKLLKVTANQLAKLVVDEYVLLDKKYDLLTNHGRHDIP